MTFKSFKEASKGNFGRHESNDPITVADVKLGLMQRIADATEKMAIRHTDLIAERDKFERWYKAEQANAARLRVSNSSLRGQITKLKKATQKAAAVPA